MFEIIFGSPSFGIKVQVSELPKVGDKVVLTKDNVLGFYGAADQFFYEKILEVTSAPMILAGGEICCNLAIEI